MKMGKKTGLAGLNERTEVFMKEIFLKTTFKDRETIHEVMEGSLLENEKIIKCMEKDFLHEMMEEAMMANT